MPFDKDLRSEERKKIIHDFGISFTSYYIQVHDRETGRLIGKLVDISSGGIRLFSSDPIDIEKIYKLKIIFPDHAREDNF